MTSTDIKNELEKLNSEIYHIYEQHYKDELPEAEPITDGIIDIDLFLQTKIKILWILKEPYDEGTKRAGGGWDLPYELKDKNWLGRITHPSMNVMAYASYAILRDLPWSEMSWVNEDNNVVNNSLQEIAWINISKMPGYTRSTDTFIGKQYPIWKSLLLKQIEIINPQIIIFGNTFKHFQNDIEHTVFPSKVLKEGGRIKGFVGSNRLYIDTYHPAQSIITKEEYVDGIRDIANEWIEKNT